MMPYRARELLDVLMHTMHDEGLSVDNILMILNGATGRWEHYRHEGVPAMEGIVEDGQ